MSSVIRPLPPAEPNTAADALAAIGVGVAVVIVPRLGIGHPATHALLAFMVATYAWLRTRDRASLRSFPAALDLQRWPRRRVWAGVLMAGAGSAIAKWVLDLTVLHGRGGIAFYWQLLRDNGVVGIDGAVHPTLLVGAALGLFAVILLDGLFFSGLVQRRLGRRIGPRLAVQAQALLFALPHLYAGPDPDPLYGAFTYVAGVAYGEVYERTGSHWPAAALLWVHVFAVWLLMLAA